LRGLLAVVLLVIASSAGAAGLGRLAVLSAIGEPLRAEIDVSVSAEELETATARFAPAEAYAPAGLQYNSALNGARLAIQYRHNGRRVIDIVTTRPVNEPALQLMVELEVRGGRIMRVYNLLLGQRGDGPLREAASAVVAPEVVPAAATPLAKAAPTPAAAAAQAPPAARRTVARPPVAAAAPSAKPVAAADSAAFDREIRRLESQMIASARVLAGMLDRVEVMERQVAQLQKAFAAQSAAAAVPKPVAEQPAAEKAKAVTPAGETPPLHSPAPVSAVAATAPAAVAPEKPAAAPAASPPPVLREVTGQATTKIDPVPRASRKSDDLLNLALLVLAGGALVLFVWLGYMVWGRRSPKSAAAEPRAE